MSANAVFPTGGSVQSAEWVEMQYFRLEARSNQQNECECSISDSRLGPIAIGSMTANAVFPTAEWLRMQYLRLEARSNRQNECESDIFNRNFSHFRYKVSSNDQNTQYKWKNNNFITRLQKCWPILFCMEIVVTINDLLMFWTRWDLHKDAFSRIMNCNTQSDSESYLWEEGDFCPVLPLGFRIYRAGCWDTE